MFTGGPAGSAGPVSKSCKAARQTVLAKLFYKPIGILGAIAGRLSRRLFTAVWGRIDSGREPPRATQEHAGVRKVVAAAALEAAVFQGTRAAVDRAGARGFANLTGVWPGEREPKPEPVD